jgi:drug/metabolite transporter (DMT)-like permease
MKTIKSWFAGFLILLGLVLASSEGQYFPFINLLGVPLVFCGAIILSKMEA